MSAEMERPIMNSEETDPTKEKLVPFQALIVLSKAWKDYPPLTKNWEPRLSIDSKISVLAAGEMFSRGVVKKIIFSGGRTGGLDNPSEAEAMRDYLKTKFPKIPDGAVLIESESIDTFDQAEKTLQILERYALTRIALLTVGYQLPRAKKIFEKVGINVEQGFASEEELKSRSSHYRAFVQNWQSSGRHLKKEVEETMLRSLLLIDTQGKALRAVTNKLRYGNKAEK